MSEPDSPMILEDGSSTDTSATSINTQRQRQPRRRSNTILKILVVASLVVNSVLATILILDWIPKGKPETEHGANSEAQTESRDNRVCFTCDYLGPEITSSDTIYDVFIIPAENTMCCLRGENKVSALFQRILKNQYSHSSYGVDVSEVHGLRGAHLYLTSVLGSSLQWSSQNGFCSGVICNNGNVTIPEEGTFLVYSFIATQNYHQLSTDNNLLHIVHRKNPLLARIGEKKMLFGKTSLRNGQQTSFMAAMLNLRSKDVLRVGISENFYQVLDSRPNTNYFGVIKM